jgi:hypothetical protein
VLRLACTLHEVLSYRLPSGQYSVGEDCGLEVGFTFVLQYNRYLAAAESGGNVTEYGMCSVSADTKTLDLAARELACSHYLHAAASILIKVDDCAVVWCDLAFVCTKHCV